MYRVVYMQCAYAHMTTTLHAVHVPVETSARHNCPPNNRIPIDFGKRLGKIPEKKVGLWSLLLHVLLLILDTAYMY